ncbi:transposase, partial [Chloroflexus sp.]|uniref:transposase n=1 Tax=Chloroflexus sp. TaxID=1904827 RepID=UPI003C771A91
MVVAGSTERGTTATGWVVDYTLHLMGTDRSECLYLMRAPGTGDKRHPVRKIVHTQVGTVLGKQGDHAPAHRPARRPTHTGVPFPPEPRHPTTL